VPKAGWVPWARPSRHGLSWSRAWPSIPRPCRVRPTLGFGDEDKAQELLQQALRINPRGIDPLYFWGDHLYRQGRYAQAREALQQALQAPPRAGRELADRGRRGEIEKLLQAVNQELD
jgi:tetratricopeptide (TPR) repeat protein